MQDTSLRHGGATSGKEGGLPEPSSIDQEGLNVLGNVQVSPVNVSFIAFILGLGVVAFSLGIAAEITRTKDYQHRVDAYQLLYCHYRSNPAAYFGVAALLLLSAAEVLTLTTTGFSWWSVTASRGSPGQRYATKTVTVVLLICNWAFQSIAVSTLMAASVENQFHTKGYILYGQHLHCSTVAAGIFASGAVFGLLSTMAMSAYYLVGTKTTAAMWREVETSDDSMVAMEAYSSVQSKPDGKLG
eukprot:TRINITY_DN6592_c0_g2_i1.p1 TRINITY_DN6592_c0_g2~~TRINITY_DN6592_c0_g2_i1.p1  ORF type:complete len:243 (-),score=42.98 TRINITY_DN6592_c0_g2_i1:228-956(-)